MNNYLRTAWALVFSLTGLVAYAEPESLWKTFVQTANQYELVSDQMRCPILNASYRNEKLSVQYQCMGPEGLRHGYFRGRQISADSFKGRYYVRSVFGNINGQLEITFLTGGEILLVSRQAEYRIAIQQIDGG